MRALVGVSVAVVVLVCLLESGFGQRLMKDRIRCYQCNSFYDKGCADFFMNATYPLYTCPENATMCRKIVQEVYYENEWNIRYIRTCAVLGTVGPDEGRWCTERTGTYRVKVRYCHCDNKDGCNGSGRPFQTLLTLIPMSLLVFALGNQRT